MGPEEAVRMLSELSCDLVDDDERRPEWTNTLADAPNRGRIRPEVRELAVAALRRAGPENQGAAG
jgi:hypothetical protein